MSDPIVPPTPRPDTAIADTMPPTPKEVIDRPEAAGRGPDKIPRQFGRYRIGECLGKGGMGAVFKAHDTQLDRQVALKVPFLGDDAAETKQRFYREARAAATLHHANICPVFDVGEFAGMPYLTMAFIEGRSLAQARAAGQTFSWVQIAVLVRKLALAMHEAHERGVVHRDLKPANVLLRANNEPTIMDFGLARRSDDKKSHGLTQEGDILGTVDYMSPEQVKGDIANVGKSSDIYALGVILYELLTGRLPFEGTTTAILAYILVKEVTPPHELRPDVPPRLEEICLKAMAREPSDRFATMAQFAAALGDYLRAFSQNAATTITRAAESPFAQAKADTTPPAKVTVATPAAERRTPPDRPSSADVSPPAESKPPRSSSKRARSSRRRKAKPQQRSYLPLILGGIAMLVALGGIAAAAVAFWPSGEKKAAQVTAPTVPQVPPRPQGPPIGPPVRPSNPSPAPPTNPPQPKTRGFAVRVQPESVTLTVGTPVKVTLKIERKEYQGPIQVSWAGVKDVRVTPGGPVTSHPGQPDPVLTLSALSDPADQKQQLNITAVPAQDTQRGSATASLSIDVPPGPCARVVEIGDKPAGAIESMAFSPDGSIALIGGGSGKQDGPNQTQAEERNAIQVWNLDRGAVLSALAGHTNKVIGLAVSADGKTALSVSADETIATWDLTLGKRKYQSPKQILRVLTAAMSADGKRGLIVYPGSDKSHGLAVKVSLDTNFQPIHQPINTAALLGSKVEDAVRATAISADRKLGLIGGVNGKLYLIDMIKADAKPKPLVGHSEAVLCAAFSPVGGYAATAGGGVLQVGTLQAGKDNAVRMWHLANATLEWTGEGHTASVVSMAFSSDGNLLATGAANGEVRVWNAADGKPVAAFTGHTGRVLALAFSADHKKLSSGAADRTLRQWRLP